MKVPQWLKHELMAAYRNPSSYDHWFPVHSKRANERLCKMFGLTTDHAEYQIGNAFRVRFHWPLMIWYVG